MQAAMDLVLPYLHERKQFDRPIGTFELMQGKIADMYTALQSSRAYCYRVAQNCSKGQVAGHRGLDRIGGDGGLCDHPPWHAALGNFQLELLAGRYQASEVLFGDFQTLLQSFVLLD